MKKEDEEESMHVDELKVQGFVIFTVGYQYGPIDHLDEVKVYGVPTNFNRVHHTPYLN